MFRHHLVPTTELGEEIIDGKRFYTLPDGVTKLKSVTTILGEKLDKSALKRWKDRVGEEEAEKVVRIAGRRGKAIHSMAERYVLNEEIDFKREMPFNVETFRPIRPILEEHVDDVLGVEVPLYSTALGCAGRTDLVAHYNGVPSIIDYKTSRKIKKEKWIEGYLLQSTVYSMMFERRYKIEIPQIVVLISVDNECEPQVFVKDRNQYVNRVLEIFTGS